jgi:hypothetical protein
MSASDKLLLFKNRIKTKLLKAMLKELREERYAYYQNGRPHKKGIPDIDEMVFQINRVKIFFEGYGLKNKNELNVSRMAMKYGTKN